MFGLFRIALSKRRGEKKGEKRKKKRKTGKDSLTLTQDSNALREKDRSGLASRPTSRLHGDINFSLEAPQVQNMLGEFDQTCIEQENTGIEIEELLQ